MCNHWPQRSGTGRPHDALRANFGPDGETLCVREMLNRPAATDLSGLSVARRAMPVARLKLRSKLRSRSSACAVPAELLKLGNRMAVVPDRHHIISWLSWWLIVRELGALSDAQPAS